MQAVAQPTIGDPQANDGDDGTCERETKARADEDDRQQRQRTADAKTREQARRHHQLDDQPDGVEACVDGAKGRSQLVCRDVFGDGSLEHEVAKR